LKIFCAKPDGKITIKKQPITQPADINHMTFKSNTVKLEVVCTTDIIDYKFAGNTETESNKREVSESVSVHIGPWWKISSTEGSPLMKAVIADEDYNKMNNFITNIKKILKEENSNNGTVVGVLNCMDFFEVIKKDTDFIGKLENGHLCNVLQIATLREIKDDKITPDLYDCVHFENKDKAKGNDEIEVNGGKDRSEEIIEEILAKKSKNTADEIIEHKSKKTVDTVIDRTKNTAEQKSARVKRVEGNFSELQSKITKSAIDFK